MPQSSTPKPRLQCFCTILFDGTNCFFDTFIPLQSLTIKAPCFTPRARSRPSATPCCSPRAASPSSPRTCAACAAAAAPTRAPPWTPRRRRRGMWTGSNVCPGGGEESAELFLNTGNTGLKAAALSARADARRFTKCFRRNQQKHATNARRGRREAAKPAEVRAHPAHGQPVPVRRRRRRDHPHAELEHLQRRRRQAREARGARGRGPGGREAGFVVVEAAR